MSNPASHRKGLRMALLIGVPLVLAAIAIVAVVAAGFWPVKSDLLRRRVEMSVGKASKASCTIGSLTIRLFTGASADNVVFEKAVGRGSALRAAARSVRVSYRFKVLMSALPTLVSRNGSVPADTAHHGKGFSGWLSALTKTRLGSAIRDVSLSGVEVSYGDAKKRVADVGDAALRVSLGADGELRGTMSAQSVAAGPVELLQVSSGVRVDGGTVGLSDLEARSFGGTLRGMGSVDLDRMRIDTAFVKGRDIDLQRLFALAVGAKGSMRGSGEIDVRVPRCALAGDSIAGNGTATLTDVTIRDMPLQRELFVALLLPELEEVKFSKATVAFAFGRKRVTLASVDAAGTPFGFAASGWISYTGFCDLKINGRIAGRFLSTLPPVVRKSLEPAENGDGRFSCRVKGNVNSPEIEFSRATINRAVQGVVEELGKELGKYFR